MIEDARAVMSVVAEERISIPAAQPIFSRHETFPVRNGWLKKAFDAFSSEPGVFSRDDAAIVLGVGKNMAKAIRYWALAFKIGEESFNKTTKSKFIVPTQFGKNLLGDNGWDPYLEDPASLWLLHWKLLRQPCLATMWSFAFHNFRHLEFTQEDLLNELSIHVKLTWPESEFASATLKNDVSCFVRMYSKDAGNKHVSEETIGSPFTELDLLTRLNGGKHFAFHNGPKANLPNALVAVAALEYAESVLTSERSINISQLVYFPGSPGLAFKLPESSVYAALDEAAENRKDISISQTAGMIRLQFTKEPREIAENILAQYYSTSRR
ncbi:MAG: DUF4007 family protein [Candidatus Melainabacteria bacterium]|nr:DUF4007 family protein [Candidatus Melainabacteria bacterium]